MGGINGQPADHDKIGFGGQTVRLQGIDNSDGSNPWELGPGEKPADPSSVAVALQKAKETVVAFLEKIGAL